MDYQDFLESKKFRAPESGIEVDPESLHPSLFPFQRDLVTWAVRKGRAAVFADTGLGKTRMELQWAQAIGKPTLILAPLAVAHQTVREAESIGMDVAYVRDQDEADGRLISISNYERLDRFNPQAFDAVVLDESSILKAFSGATKRLLVKSFRDTPYRLAATATPAPNDIEELTNHADFLSVMRANEMRSTFFIADSRGEFMKYRLKGHAHSAFYRFLASWSAAIKKPSDLGYDDDGFILPPLRIVDHVVGSDWAPEGMLFATGTKGVGEASAVRKHTLEDRCHRAAEIVQAEPDEPWLIWVGTNAEADLMHRLLPDATEVRGSDHPDHKAEALLGFANGDIHTLITKSGIAGFGMNFQRAARMVFVGLGYSYEQYYQSIRRCWRFGQKRPVDVHIVISEPERDIIHIVREKEAQATRLTSGLLKGMVAHTRDEIYGGTSAGDAYEPTMTASLPDWIVRTQ